MRIKGGQVFCLERGFEERDLYIEDGVIAAGGPPRAGNTTPPAAM